ncbi:MAG: DUF3047 domain-containing protein [Nitrosomonas sp.]|nr:DUF3047 domain-containing protein [Nitrosomonas sp.]
MKKQLCWIVACLFPLATWAVDNRIDIARFSQGDLGDWQSKFYSDGMIFWRNAFTRNAVMIAVQSGTEHVGRWMKQSRDVRADYRRIFGQVDAVAIMTDIGNTSAAATAWYGDTWFSAR